MLFDAHEIPLQLMRAVFADGRWDGRLTLTASRGGRPVRVTAGADKDAQARRLTCEVPLDGVLPMQCSLLRARARSIGSGMPALTTGDASFDAAFNLRGLPEFLVLAGLNDAAREGLLRHVDVLRALDVERQRITVVIDARRATPDSVAALVQIQTRLAEDLEHASRAHLSSLPEGRRTSARAGFENDLSAAQATQRRASGIVGLVTVVFVVALLAGVAVLFARSLP